MTELLLAFFVQAVAFSAILMCLFARKRGGPSWLAVYALFLFSCILYALVRNLGYFFQFFVLPLTLEENLAYFACYCLANAFFSCLMFRQALILAHVALTGPVRLLHSAFCALPLLVLAAGAGVSRVTGTRVLPLFFSVGMYEVFAAYLGVSVFLAFRYRNIHERLNRRLVAVNLVAGGIYFVLSIPVYSDLLTMPYYIDSAWVLHASLLVIFAGSLVIVARSFLMDPVSEVRPPAIPVPGHLDENTRKLVLCICLGMSNEEIALELGVSLQTVKSRLYRLFRKFGVQTRTGLIHALQKDGEKSSASGAGKPL